MILGGLAAISAKNGGATRVFNYLPAETRWLAKNTTVVM